MLTSVHLCKQNADTFNFVPSSVKAKNSPCIALSWSCSGLALGIDELCEHRPIFNCLGHSSPAVFASSTAWPSPLKVKYSFKVILSAPGFSWTRLDLLLCPDLWQRLTTLALCSYLLPPCLLTPLLVICKWDKYMLTDWEISSLNSLNTVFELGCYSWWLLLINSCFTRTDSLRSTEQCAANVFRF